ncbi:DNA-binding response regulator, NarL/FixJ family, contains REC and HTH domains [Lentzea waywayandensis]|uniref:DNA-binding response regulator, NarL/FixJ family, contains REC and HTH domains n=1 Tax=Lentzea waywayandensis TaxID=84724 RepID=A0A1I6DBP8_9PSEU|nr:response regulator transcription factor [Lentzea waywayandensis]SFR02880.1 DNA-binding response regulator, NarL/FixJ family, contains REC and HTH domains [Lentzea waywayandensis]
MTIRVLIADDQEMIRSAFGMILGTQPDMEVVASVADGESAVEQARRLRPDVCLLDIRMPALDGLEATRLLAGPGVDAPLNVLIATTFDLDEYVYRALRNGACGFLLKDMSPALLIEAVRAASTGTSLISPAVTVRLLSKLAPARQAGESTVDRPLPEPLTDRELDVVKLVANGHTNDEIGAKLYVSVATVKTHLANAQRKLAVRNRVEIAAWAWRTGVVTG